MLFVGFGFGIMEVFFIVIILIIVVVVVGGKFDVFVF